MFEDKIIRLKEILGLKTDFRSCKDRTLSSIRISESYSSKIILCPIQMFEIKDRFLGR